MSYSEQQTEDYYHKADLVYRLIWDRSGLTHWGIFDEGSEDFDAAALRVNEVMAEKLDLKESSVVLDLGCGTGVTARWLAQKFGCQVGGVDLSKIRIDAANEDITKNSPELEDRVRFLVGSATDVPLEDASVTHVIAQAMMYHVHDVPMAMREICRVLVPGGVFVFDDLLTLIDDVSKDTREYVYDRLKYDGSYDESGYRETLKDVGLVVDDYWPLHEHMGRSYRLLAQRATQAMTTPEAKTELEHLEWLVTAYEKTANVIDAGELGWGLFRTHRPSKGMVQEVYKAGGDMDLLRDIYDRWAKDYDGNLEQEHGWRGPQAVAAQVLIAAEPSARVLDAGVGTGLVGTLLAKEGFSHVDGCDISDGMLDRAREKGDYKQLFVAELGTPLSIDSDTYDLVCASGVFTHGHAPANSFDELVRIVRPGGDIIFTLPESMGDTGEYADKIEAMSQAGSLSVTKRTEPEQILPQSEDAKHQVWVLSVL